MGNLAVEAPTIAEELAAALETMQKLTVIDDDTIFNRMLPLAANVAT